MPRAITDTDHPCTRSQPSPASNDLGEALNGLSRQARGRLLLAVQLFKSGDIPRALAECHAIVEQHPGCGFALFLNGVLLKAIGDTSNASELARQAIDAGYTPAHAWLFHANLCDEQRRSGQALTSAEQAVSADPENATALLTLGRLLMEQGQAASAVAVLKQAAARAPQTATIHYRLALALLATGQEKQAQQAAEAALSTTPFDFQNRMSLGKLLLERGDIAQAVEEFSAASELPVRNAGTALAELGKTFFKVGDWDQAVDALQRAVEINPKDYNSFLLLGKISMSRGDLERSQEWLSAAVEIDENAPEAKSMLSDVEAAMRSSISDKDA